MDAILTKELCRLGDKADSYSASGFYEKAREHYKSLTRELKKTNTRSPLVLSKIALSVLLLNVREGNLKEAFSIWNSDPGTSDFGAGIHELENGHASVHDLILYDFICGYLHSLSAGPTAKAARAVNLYMSRICEHATEEGDRILLKMTLNNWKQHLRELYPTAVPQEHAFDLIHYERGFGEPVKLAALGFPKPTPWSDLLRGVNEEASVIRERPFYFTEGATARKAQKKS